MQFSLRAQLGLVTAAAILCSFIKVATLFVPIELLGFAGLVMVVAAVPAALIGRWIGRTFGAIYMGVIWGLWAAMLVIIPDILAWFLPFSESPNLLYTAAKVTAGALVGGCFGGLVMWWIKKRANDSIAPLECGDLSPLSAATEQGYRSVAKSGDKSPHSKGRFPPPVACGTCKPKAHKIR